MLTTRNILLLSIFFFFTNCGNEDNGASVSIDRSAMLSDIGNYIILPGYQSLQAAEEELSQAINAFTSEPTEASLATAKEKFKTTYLAWQKVNMFEFGPAEQNLLRSSVNIYPLDDEAVENNIESGSYDLETLANNDTKGFPAIDYLLFSKEPAALLEDYTTAELAPNRKKYLQDVTQAIHGKVATVTHAWEEEGGDYLHTFIASTGLDAGSSTSMMVNAMVLQLEKFTRNGKVAIPLGKLSGGVPRPLASEAYYSGISQVLLAENLKAFERLFQGIGLQDTQNRKSLSDYLIELNRKDLSDKIAGYFTTANAEIGELNGPIAEEVNSNQEQVERVYTEIQSLVLLLKNDLTSAMGISISYVDNDGD
ncbi:imelysin family protein [Rapidithrix thailandica]|uniref:Imelysin family protein n=1 Tax=Rapidithrix thailandica TaxID=413964 RepID=A0AAW9SDM3_9BACT